MWRPERKYYILRFRDVSDLKPIDAINDTLVKNASTVARDETPLRRITF